MDAFQKLPDSSQSATILWLVVWLACPQWAKSQVFGRTSQPHLMQAQHLIPRHTYSYLKFSSLSLEISSLRLPFNLCSFNSSTDAYNIYHILIFIGVNQKKEILHSFVILLEVYPIYL